MVLLVTHSFIELCKRLHHKAVIHEGDHISFGMCLKALIHIDLNKEVEKNEKKNEEYGTSNNKYRMWNKSAENIIKNTLTLDSIVIQGWMIALHEKQECKSPSFFNLVNCQTQSLTT